MMNEANKLRYRLGCVSNALRIAFAMLDQLKLPAEIEIEGTSMNSDFMMAMIEMDLDQFGGKFKRISESEVIEEDETPEI